MKFHTFTDELKKLAPNSPSGGANVVQKGKRKMQVFEIKHLHFVGYPVDYLFSNQFMEDLGRIYSLRKFFPSFYDEKTEGTKQSAD